MKLVVTIGTIDSQHGGPARTIPALCRALVEQNVDLELVTIVENRQDPESLLLQGINTTVVRTAATRYQPRSWSKQLTEALHTAVGGKEHRDKQTVLYDVGLWLPSNHFATQVAKQTATPLVISPRGMLSKEALKVAKWKKRIAWNLYQRRDLGRARVLHATSQREAEDLRELGLKQPIAVVPNGVEIPPGIRGQKTDDREQISNNEERMTDNAGERTLLFLSRLHPMKGLKDLVQAWAKARPQGWRVIIAGPNESNHQQEIERLAESLCVKKDFDFVGPVDDQQKWELLSKSHLFVLPSYSESFGMAIAEALAAGVPVVTTRATPWRDIEVHKCGWWVDSGVDSIAQALRSATACDGEELREIGRRGRKLVQTKYSWESAATQLLSTFEWILGRAEKPVCVN